MRFHLIDEQSVEVTDPYEVRVSGWTEERYFAEAPEERFYEFKDGELIVHSPVNIEHQDVVGFLTFLLRGVVSRGPLGKVYNGPGVLRVRPNLDREPDIFFVSAEHLTNVTREYVKSPADFVIEVLSGSGRTRDLQEKPEEYADAGITEYWVVDLDRQEVVAHRLGRAGYDVHRVTQGRLESVGVPGFWIDVGWVWQRPMPGELDCLNAVLG